MNKKEILNKIRERTGNNSIKFPSQMDFSIVGNKLMVRVHGNGVIANMQTDGSAFEGWTICLMAFMQDYVKEVVLAWNSPVYSQKDMEKQEKHYNRFVFRAMMFEEVYNWFSVSIENRSEIKRLKTIIPILVVNYPKSESKEKVSVDGKVYKGEAVLERQLVSVMRKTISITDHQLPVGLFKQKVHTDYTFTPRGASQIDIWQLDRDILRIFELKDKDNNSVGIISELMFYVHVMRLLNLGVIKFPDSLMTKKKNYRHIDDLYSAINAGKVKNIEAVFLNYEFHPFIECKKDDIMRIINEGTYKNQVSFSYQLVSHFI